MKQLISGSLDGNVMVWNFKPKLRALRFVGHKGAVYSVAFSPTNALIASGSKDRTIRLWQPTVEGRSTVLKGHTGAVRCVKFSADGRNLISCADDKTVKVWSLPSQRFQFTLSGHLNWVRSCSFSPDGRLAASGGDDKIVRIWDLRTKRPLRIYESHTASVNSVQFHPDGTCVASAGSDNTIRVWDVRTDALLQLYKEHTGAVTSVAFHPCGSFLLSSSLDSTLKVWDIREGRLFYTLHGHEGATLGTDFSPSGDFFASCGADEQVMVWKTNFDRHLDDVIMVPPAEKHTLLDPPVAGSVCGKTGTGVEKKRDVPRPKSVRNPSKPQSINGSQRQDTNPRPCEKREAFSEKPSAINSVTKESNDCCPRVTATAAPVGGEEGNEGGVGGWGEVQDNVLRPTLDQILDKQEVGGVSLPPPMDLGDLPEPLAATLQHIVGEINVMSQTLALVVERLTINEDRVRKLGEELGQAGGKKDE